MTRDEAIKIARAAVMSEKTTDVLSKLIDASIALGMLKVEQPKTKREEFKQLLKKAGYDTHSGYSMQILQLYDMVHGK